MTRKSFTLIELIVVIAIIAILAAIIAPNAFKAIEKAKVSRAIADMKSVKNAVLALYADTGHWLGDDYCACGVCFISIDEPRANPAFCRSDIMINFSNWLGWDGPYLEKNVGPSPWNNLYLVQNFMSRADSDMRLIVLNFCYQDSGVVCPIPDDAYKRVDSTLDDGDLATGNLIKVGDSIRWLMIHN